MLKEFQKKYPNLIYLLIGLVIILIIINGILITTTFKYKIKLDNSDIIIFTFKGENELISIDDGLIIITPNNHQVSLGKVDYIGLKDESIKFYSNKLYLKDSEVINTIMTDAVSFKGDDFYTSIKEVLKSDANIGEISSKTLFNKEDLEKIKDNLFLEFKYETINGDFKKFDIKLNVKRYNKDS